MILFFCCLSLSCRLCSWIGFHKDIKYQKKKKDWFRLFIVAIEINKIDRKKGGKRENLYNGGEGNINVCGSGELKRITAPFFFSSTISLVRVALLQVALRVKYGRHFSTPGGLVGNI